MEESESEKISQTGEMKSKMKASAKALATLMKLNGMPGSGSTSGATDAVLLQIAANAFNASGTESALISGLEVEVPTACTVWCCGALLL